MYNSKFVASIKSNGQILREQNDEVFLPFGTEYSILLKNLNSSRALVTVEIDGKSIGNQLIINSNSTLELERFIEDLNQGSRFKFIEKTEKIKQHRGDRVDDGLVRIEYQFEQFVNYTWTTYYPNTFLCNDKLQDNNYTITCSSATLNYDGITTKGSISDQKFVNGSIGYLEPQKHVIILKLKGTKETGSVVTQPLIVKEKLICEICGTSNKSNHKFCCECGTYLD